MNAPISAALPARPRRAPCRQGPGRDTAPARPGKPAAGWVSRLPWRSSVSRGCRYGINETACASRKVVDAQVDCLFGPRVLRSGRHLKQTQGAPVKQVRVETEAQELLISPDESDFIITTRSSDSFLEIYPLMTKNTTGFNVF